MEHKKDIPVKENGMPPRSFFFLSGEATPERVHWIRDAVLPPAGRAANISSPRYSIYLTGEALISLADSRNAEYWNSIMQEAGVDVIADGEEIRLHGLAGHLHQQYPRLFIPGEGKTGEELSFWHTLVVYLMGGDPVIGKAGFLLCQGPYMSRTPVYMLRFLKSAVEQGIRPEIYAYLDGVHAAHLDQKPSEFENIGEGISSLSIIAGETEGEGWFGACSRCATARGYFIKDPDTGTCRPSSCIPAIRVRALKEILERFNAFHPILAHCCGGTLPSEKRMHDSPYPVLNILISCSPYMSEWTFGGLSMAVATAMGGMETRVLFIEQGVYALCGDHTVFPEDRVFNVQEMIMATMDIPMLRYAVYTPSLEERGLHASSNFSAILGITPERLGNFLFGQAEGITFPQSRMMIF